MMEQPIEQMLYLLGVVDEATSWQYLSLVARTFLAAELRDFEEAIDMARDELACWGV